MRLKYLTVSGIIYIKQAVIIMKRFDLVWRQLIGFEMRRLPGIDRCVMAQGLYYVIDKNEPCCQVI